MLDSWKLYMWNHDTIYQVPAIDTTATKATECITGVCKGCVQSFTLQLLTKTWKDLYSIHITLLINKCAGGATRSC